MMNKLILLFFITGALLLSLSGTSIAESEYFINELPIFDDFPIDLPLGISITTFKGTFDILGQTELNDGDGAKKADVKNGFAISLEMGKEILEKIGVGVGATYQFPRELDEQGSGNAKFNFIPFYGLVKFWTDAAGLFPFGMVQIGYNLLLGNSEFKKYTNQSSDFGGGLYWGLGGGVILIEGIQLELLYSVNHGSLKSKESIFNNDIKYSKVSLSAGISL